MPVRSCRVTIQDMDGVSHTVEVTAATLYEAVAQGLAGVRGDEWGAGGAQALTVRGAVVGVCAEPEAEGGGFTNRVGEGGGSTRGRKGRYRLQLTFWVV